MNDAKHGYARIYRQVLKHTASSLSVGNGGFRSLSSLNNPPSNATASSIPQNQPSFSNRSILSNASSNGMSAGGRPFSKRQQSSLARAFPQYTVYGEESLLSVKPILPTYKRASADGVALEKPGRMLFEFVPRSSGRFVNDEKEMFALSVEEIGLLLNQLPKNNAVELVRQGGLMGNRLGRGYDHDTPDKVFRAFPGDGATVKFEFDYVKDGVSQPLGGGNSTMMPIEVTAQAGEFEVIKEIFRNSIPYLTGWNAMMDIQSKYAIQSASSGRPNQAGGSAFGGNAGNTYSGKPGDVPF